VRSAPLGTSRTASRVCGSSRRRRAGAHLLLAGDNTFAHMFVLFAAAKEARDGGNGSQTGSCMILPISILYSVWHTKVGLGRGGVVYRAIVVQ